ncbi:hypothetical protein E4T43_08044 [Aureobasidium subglaciale]|nr:hypothetical protein E4T43_08044 [Aureobasidium subglaciale]
MVTQSFATPADGTKLPPDYMLTTSLDTFVVDLACESAIITIAPFSGPSYLNYTFNATIVSKSCGLSVFDQQRMDATKRFKLLPNLPPENFVPNSFLASCQNATEDDQRLVMLLTLSNENLDIVNSSAIICRPSYTFGQSSIAYNNDPELRTRPLTMTGGNANSSSSFDAQQRSRLTGAIYNSTATFLTPYNSDDITEAQTSDARMFNLMTVIQGRDNSDAMLRPFLNADVMMERAAQVFNAIGAQTVAEGLLVSSDRRIMGIATFRQERLVVNGVSVILMSVAFAIICCLCVALIFVRLWDVVPRRPASAVDTISICLTSVPFKEALRNSGHLSDNGVEQKLEDYDFSLVNCHEGGRTIFALEVEKQAHVLEASRTTQRASHGILWWHPWGSSFATKLAVVLLPLACIAVLEVLQAKSNDHRGFAKLANAEGQSFEIANYATQYLPAAIMISIKLLFGGLEDVVNVFAPFLPLRKAHDQSFVKKISWLPSWLQKSDKGSYDTLQNTQGCTIKVLDYQTYGRVSVLALTSAAKHKYWPVVFSTRDDSGAGPRTIQIWDHNATYPLWTYKDLALSTIQISPESLPFANTSAAEGAQINAVVPGVRARLDCVPTSNRTVYYNMDFDRDNYSESVITRVPVNVLNTCVGHPMPNMLSTNITFSVYPEETYVAQITNLHIFQPSSVFPDPDVGTFTYSDNDAECPSLVFYIAKWSPLPDSKDYMLDFNALSCKQVVDEVQVNATLLYPSMELDPLNTPKILEGVTTNVVDAERNGSVETWQVGYQFDKWDSSQMVLTGGTSHARNQHVSRYYQMVVNGTREETPVPLDDMIGEANIDSFFKATQSVYGIYMAQLLSTKKQDLLIPTSVQASIEAMTEWRVKQHEPSKIVLQVILGIMAVCGLLTWLCMETKEVLPHNPCTIAGMVSFFADSSLWSDALSKETLSQPHDGANVFGDSGVSMGWHENHNDDESPGDAPSRHFGIDRSRRQ